MFAGLYLGEIVLLVLGVVLFVVLLGALRKALAAGRSYAGLLPFFLVTIVMIGYPSIKSLQYKDGMLQIENDTATVESPTADAETKRNAVLRLQANSAKFQDRANPADRAKITRALTAVKEWQRPAVPVNPKIEPVHPLNR